MLETLITSKTRIRLLLKFFLNAESSSYLRSLESEFGESTNAIRLELNRFEKAGMLQSNKVKNRKVYKANTGHPLFTEIKNIVFKHTGLDKIILNVINRLGAVERVYLSGDLAKGKDAEIIELIFIGEPDIEYLKKLLKKAEPLASRKIEYLIYTNDEIKDHDFPSANYLLLWSDVKLYNESC